MEVRSGEADTFIHSGVVSEIKGNSVIVSLDKNVHCESCSAKGACGVVDSTVKTVEITNSDRSFSINEPVEVVLKKNLGHKAVFWAYIFPFLLMLATLMTTSLFLVEWIAGVLSLLILVPYYTTVYVFKDYFKRTFSISILRI